MDACFRCSWERRIRRTIFMVSALCLPLKFSRNLLRWYNRSLYTIVCFRWNREREICRFEDSDNREMPDNGDGSFRWYGWSRLLKYFGLVSRQSITFALVASQNLEIVLSFANRSMQKILLFLSLGRFFWAERLHRVANVKRSWKKTDITFDRHSS